MSLAAAYTKTASYFHWIVAVPLVGAVGTVLKAQSLPKEAKEEKMKLMFTHKSLGLLTGILVAPRLVYRIINMGKFSTVEKLPGTGPVLSALSNFNHLGLYLFMIGYVVPCT
jgi:cytochrome b561